MTRPSAFDDVTLQASASFTTLNLFTLYDNIPVVISRKR